MTLLDNHLKDIRNLCIQYKVKCLYAFGSVYSTDFSHESDIDLIVDFQHLSSKEYADNYYEFKFALEGIFERSVDLLEEKAIKNPYFKKAIYSQRKLIYGY